MSAEFFAESCFSMFMYTLKMQASISGSRYNYLSLLTASLKAANLPIGRFIVKRLDLKDLYSRPVSLSFAGLRVLSLPLLKIKGTTADKNENI